MIALIPGVSFAVTRAFFSDTATSTSNTFSAAESFGTPTPTLGEQPEAAPGKIVINEVSSLGDNNFEWVELFNSGGSSVDLTGWTIVDGDSSSDNLSAITIPAGGYAIVVTNNEDSSIISSIPGEAQTITLASPTIGDGLTNTGDAVTIKDNTSSIVDSMSYGTDISVFTGVAAPTTADTTLRRITNGTDTDVAGDWQVGTSSIGVSN